MKLLTIPSVRGASWLVQTSVRSRLLLMMGILAIFVWYVPLAPELPTKGLDAGWVIALSVASEREVAFGTDFIITFGPYGYLVPRLYWPSTYVASIVFYATIALLSSWLLLDAAATWRRRLVGFAAIVWLGLTIDTVMLSLPLAYVFNAYLTEKRSAASWLGLLALAPLALSKFTLLPLCALTVIAASTMRSRRVVADMLIESSSFATAVVIAWQAAHQKIGALPAYVLSGVELSRGYAQAMTSPTGWSLKAIIWLSLSIVVCGLAGCAGVLAALEPAPKDKSGRARLGFVLFVICGLLMTLRQSVTRADAGHLLVCTSFCGALGLLCLLLEPYRGRWFVLLAGLSAITTVTLMEGRYQGKGGGNFALRLLESGRGIRAIATLHDPRGELNEALARNLRLQSGEDFGLTSIKGSYDVLGHDQYLLSTLGSVNWTPRPIFQSYVAYTPKLAAANHNFLASERAPEWLISGVRPIDNRYPSMDDAASWPLLQTHYAFSHRASEHVVLRRRRTPQSRGSSHTVPISWSVSSWTELPALNSAEVFASVRLEKTVLDRLRSLLWKPPVHFLEVRTTSSRAIRSFRIIDEIAAAGFMLCPLIETTDQLEHWLSGNGPTSGLSAIRVVDERGHAIPAQVTIQADPFTYP